jgi:hypothetical protein
LSPKKIHGRTLQTENVDGANRRIDIWFGKRDRMAYDGERRLLKPRTVTNRITNKY